MQQSEIIILYIGFILVFALFIIGLVLLLNQSKKNRVSFVLEKELTQQKHHKEILSTQLEMQTQTMQEIGREIHDNVGQKLTLASLYTQQLDYDNRYPEIAERVNSISGIINDSLHELRTLSKSLTNDSFATETLQNLLETELEKVRKLFVLDTRIPDIAIHNLSVKTILVRILQEFLQNTIKYAKASQLHISLANEPEGIRFVLNDNGVGFDPAKNSSNGIGLKNMKKRVALVGGEFNLQSAVNQGTHIEVFIPTEKL